MSDKFEYPVAVASTDLGKSDGRREEPAERREWPSRSEAIANALRSQIVSRELKPGTRLPEDKFAAEFGVSRVPVREAIQRLTAEGYVTVTPNAGARVALQSKRDAKELLQIWTALEALAARLAAELRGGEHLPHLEAVLVEAEGAVARKAFATVPELSAKFHGLIIDASGNETLIRMLADVRAKLTWTWAVDVEERAPVDWSAHRDIFKAIVDADPERASGCVADHLSMADITPRDDDEED
jgi:DNA-binding GntR family transcriptional regulator